MSQTAPQNILALIFHLWEILSLCRDSWVNILHGLKLQLSKVPFSRNLLPPVWVCCQSLGTALVIFTDHQAMRPFLMLAPPLAKFWANVLGWDQYFQSGLCSLLILYLYRVPWSLTPILLLCTRLKCLRSLTGYSGWIAYGLRHHEVCRPAQSVASSLLLAVPSLMCTILI